MIYNLGSINIDYFYSVSRLPVAGETYAASEFDKGLGGKGANMSVAIARAGANVRHIGCVGKDGAWALDYLQEAGVDTSGVTLLDDATGHAVILRDEAGENAIVIYPGANGLQDECQIETSLKEAVAGDLLVLQNETNLQAFAAQLGSQRGMRVAYAAAPFDVHALQAVMPFLQILILNEVEMAQLKDQTGYDPEDLGVEILIVTRGAEGCDAFLRGADRKHFPAYPAQPVDTTGAGDTFTGYFLASLDQRLDVDASILRANAAASIMVTRKGTADAIPFASEIDAVLG